MVKLAIVSLHPNNYHDGIWVRLCKRNNLDVTLLYLSDEGLSKFYYPIFRAELNWSAFIDLDQYPHKFIRNYGRSFSAVPFSRMNPGIFNEITHEKYDAVLVHGYATISAWLAILAARLHSKPLIFRGEGVLRPSDNHSWRHWLKKRLLLKAFRLFDAFLYDCAGNRRLFEHYGVPSEKLFFMPCTVNNDFFQDERLKWANRRAEVELSLDAKVFLVVFVGRLTPRKRPMDILKSLHLAQTRGRRDIGIVFVGDGPEREQMEQFIESHGVENVRLAGYQDQSQVGKYYAMADAGIVISEYDPSPRVVNEMMNFALPMLCSEGVGTAYDLVQDGVNGYIVSIGNIESIADSLCKLADDRERSQRMGQKSLEIVLTWNFERDAEAIENAVKHAMS